MGIHASGKGTQAKILADKLKIAHISSGKIFRELGTKKEYKYILNYLNKGILVPDKTINELFQIQLSNKKFKKGFILDGYPRNINQAKFLLRNFNINKVIYIKLSKSEALKRVLGRRICSNPKCQATYNINTSPKPKINGICDKCGSKLIKRDDESRESLLKRINIFINETKPLLEFFKKKIIKINGNQSIKNVASDIEKAIL